MKNIFGSMTPLQAVLFLGSMWLTILLCGCSTVNPICITNCHNMSCSFCTTPTIPPATNTVTLPKVPAISGTVVK